MSVAQRQTLIARFLDDPAFEAELRRDPRRIAATHGFELALVRWLAALPRYRVEGFRRSQAVKATRRGETKP